MLGNRPFLNFKNRGAFGQPLRVLAPDVRIFEGQFHNNHPRRPAFPLAHSPAGMETSLRGQRHGDRVAASLCTSYSPRCNFQGRITRAVEDIYGALPLCSLFQSSSRVGSLAGSNTKNAADTISTRRICHLEAVRSLAKLNPRSKHLTDHSKS